MSYRNPIEDELAIRDLIARYTDGVNRFDADTWAATWAEDGYWNLLGMETRGRDNIRQFWLGAMGTFKFALHQVGSGTLDIDGDTASGRWYLTEYTCDQEDNRGMVVGVYDDKYVKVDGSWYFSERRYQTLYMGPADLSGDHQAYANPA